jgi:hypothetical protein
MSISEVLDLRKEIIIYYQLFTGYSRQKQMLFFLQKNNKPILKSYNKDLL